MEPPRDEPDPDRQPGDVLVLALLTPVVGAAAGVLGALFRLSLEWAEALRDGWADAMQDRGILGLMLLMAGCALAAALAAWMVRRFSPYASGSGIPHVEAVMEEKLPPVPFRLIPVKFFGGVLAIGSGLALGREGPTVQMGASVADLVGTLFRRGWADRRILIAAGAGAGLATAFNAPIAGAIFVLEELMRRFEPRNAMVALGASATAILAARPLVGDLPDFPVASLAIPEVLDQPGFLLLGLLCGLLAVGYNRVLLATLDVAEQFSRVPVEIRAGSIGAAVGMLAWFAPGLVGGGDHLTQQALNGIGALSLLPALFVLRLALGSASYAAGTPGGLFAPMLVLGAQLGLACGLVLQWVFPAADITPAAFALVGMSAFFTGVVRAPLTGIVLVIEMTGVMAMLLPMLIASFAAMLVPLVLGRPPIYHSLRERLLRSADR